MNGFNGYVLEVSIPWTTLGMTPTNNLAGRFDVNIDDNQTGGGRTTQAGWNSADNQDTKLRMIMDISIHPFARLQYYHLILH